MQKLWAHKFQNSSNSKIVVRENVFFCQTCLIGLVSRILAPLEMGFFFLKVVLKKLHIILC